MEQTKNPITWEDLTQDEKDFLLLCRKNPDFKEAFITLRENLKNQEKERPDIIDRLEDQSVKPVADQICAIEYLHKYEITGEKRLDPNCDIELFLLGYIVGKDDAKKELHEADVVICKDEPATKPGPIEKPSNPVSERMKKRDAERTKRILKDFEDANKFSRKHDNHGLRLDYIDNLFTMDPFYAIRYCHDLGFRSGFNKGKKANKEGAANGKR